ncbi:KxYKxGKxW signal peptide domain-containing protein [Oenococcus oeni]
MFLKKGKKKLYKSGKNWVATLLLSAAALSFYSAGQTSRLPVRLLVVKLRQLAMTR